MAEWPRTVEVAAMMASNMRQPLSCQVGSPVMRYMYHTDSIASGLGRELVITDVWEDCIHLPEDVFARSDIGESGW